MGLATFLTAPSHCALDIAVQYSTVQYLCLYGSPYYHHHPYTISLPPLPLYFLLPLSRTSNNKNIFPRTFFNLCFITLTDCTRKMAGAKISTTASTAPIEGVDSEDVSLNAGSPAPSMQSTLKDYGLLVFGEFLGTFLFLFFAFGGTQAVKINHVGGGGSPPKDPTGAVVTPDLLLYVAMCFGFSLTVNVWVFYRVTGALFNPAITLGCVLTGGVPPLKGVLVGIAQIVGGIAASGLVEGLTPGELAVGTTLAPGVSVVQGLFIELFLTAQLMLTIFLLAVEKHRATFIAPLGIGLSFFITQLFGVYFTGGSLNPARSLGPAVITGDFPGHHWIYWVGPALGAALGAAVYKILLLVDYKTLNPGQDSDGLPIVRCEYGPKGKFRGAQEGQVISGPSGTASKLADENV
ncbi:unnamed protein product [Tuber aestivum]|uniref:Aquaporin n=1 Tax=Tuber aestivum TaxID=59557 RepID=A0A292Q6V3_9PEZI|nr:unnamed protein product [Tuber aestivum]